MTRYQENAEQVREALIGAFSSAQAMDEPFLSYLIMMAIEESEELNNRETSMVRKSNSPAA